MIKRKMNNQEFLSHMMQFSASGAIMQAVVLEGLSNYCERVKKAPAGFMSEVEELINEKTWRDTCAELLDAMNNRDRYTIHETGDDE